MKRYVRLVACHIPGKENVKADKLSRSFSHETEWRLNPIIFHQLTVRYFMPEVDLMATSLNAQLTKFVSWHADPAAIASNASYMSWKENKTLYFSSFYPDCKSFNENSSGRNTVMFNYCSSMEESTLVSKVIDTVSPTPLPVVKDKNIASNSRNRNDTPIVGKYDNVRMCLVRENLQNQGIPREATSIILDSWRESTQTRYAPTFKQWRIFCDERKINPLRGTLSDGLNCLVYKKEQWSKL